MRKFERAYGRAMKTFLWFLLPIKKIFVETLCEVHVFINNQALEILKNDGHLAEYEFFTQYREWLNKGVVWADQDFKSRDHFYNPYTHKGLYGCKTSKHWFEEYYKLALVHWDCGDKEKGIFYLGAAVHLVQDSTIPQHGNINLLKNHRSYEQWINRVHDDFGHYAVSDKGIYNASPYSYIEANSRCAIETHRRYALIKNLGDKYFRITNIMFPLAQRTTAGCLVNFYNRIHE
ncbi:MAG: zinc dependent phospholipase C family protein [Bacillota bacterium]